MSDPRSLAVEMAYMFKCDRFDVLVAMVARIQSDARASAIEEAAKVCDEIIDIELVNGRSHRTQPLTLAKRRIRALAEAGAKP